MSALQGNENVATNRSRKDAESAPDRNGLAALLEILPVGVFTLDPEQRIAVLNPAAEEIVGMVANEVLGRPCNEVLRCSFCGPSCATCIARDDGAVHRGFPTEIRRGDGSTRNLLLDAVPMQNGRVAVMLRDVTESERLRKALQDRWVFHGLVCASPVMKEIVGKVRDVAPYESTVCILGESGTGKEMVARAIHAESPRHDRPFITVNCSAYSENLLESELFGHARGSFTGAERDRRGRFELADGGTIFLDEIGEISSKVQVKLLRVLQEREVERVGESTPRSVDLRILAATNRDLGREVREGRFREDLFYRLNVFTLDLPPLRERKGDIAALVDHLLDKISQRTGKTVRMVSDEVMDTLLRHSWPGNVRELENIIESAVVRTRGDVVLATDLPDAFLAGPTAPAQRDERVRQALRRTAGCVTRAARLLGMHRTTLWRHMREAGIQRDDFLV